MTNLQAEMLLINLSFLFVPQRDVSEKSVHAKRIPSPSNDRSYHPAIAWTNSIKFSEWEIRFQSILWLLIKFHTVTKKTNYGTK